MSQLVKKIIVRLSDNKNDCDGIFWHFIDYTINGLFI